MPEDPYSKLYWRFADEFPEIYENDSALALWTRLLRLADMAWPAAATLPYRVKVSSLVMLANAGLILRVTAGTYRIRGMDKERHRRSEIGRTGGLASANARRTNVGRPLNERATWVQREEQSREEQSREEHDARENDPWRADEARAVDWLRSHKCQIREGDGYHVRLVTAVERHGVNAIIGQFDRLARAGTKDGDIKGFLFVAIDLLDKAGRPDMAALEAEDRAEERDRSWDARVEATRARARELHPEMYGEATS